MCVRYPDRLPPQNTIYLQTCQPLRKMRNHYAFQCHLRDYARKGNLSFKLRNLRVWQIKSFRLRSLVTDSRGSLSAVSTTSCQQVLESSFPSPVRKHALIGPVYLIQPIETCLISSRNQTCFTKICANCGEKTHALSLIACRWERSDYGSQCGIYFDLKFTILFNACMYRYSREMYHENRESFGSGFCVCVKLVSRYAGVTKKWKSKHARDKVETSAVYYMHC